MVAYDAHYWSWVLYHMQIVDNFPAFFRWLVHHSDRPITYWPPGAQLGLTQNPDGTYAYLILDAANNVIHHSTIDRRAPPPPRMPQ